MKQKTLDEISEAEKKAAQEENTSKPKKIKKKPKRSKKPKLPLVVRKFKKWISKLPDDFTEADIIRVYGEDALRDDFNLHIGRGFLEQRGKESRHELQVWGLSKDGEAALAGGVTA